MKNLVLLVGIGAAAFSQAAHAQNTLATVSQVETASAAATSYDYRYTRHVVGGGSGRGGGYHSTVIYTWDKYLDQATSSVLPVTSGTPQQVTTAGTFYAPTYAASATAATTLVNTPTQAVLTVNYKGATTVATTLGAHQGVTVTAQPGDTFTFTLTQECDVRVTTTGDPSGVFRLGWYSGVLLGPFYGATGGPVSLDTPLAPGTYWVTDGLSYSAGLDTQLGTATNFGTTSTAWGFTMTVTPTGASSGGGGGNGGDHGGSGGSGGSDD